MERRTASTSVSMVACGLERTTYGVQSTHFISNVCRDYEGRRVPVAKAAGIKIAVGVTRRLIALVCSAAA